MLFYNNIIKYIKILKTRSFWAELDFFFHFKLLNWMWFVFNLVREVSLNIINFTFYRLFIKVLIGKDPNKKQAKYVFFSYLVKHSRDRTVYFLKNEIYSHLTLSHNFFLL